MRNHMRASQKLIRTNKLYNHVNKYGWDDMRCDVLYSLKNQGIPTQDDKDLLCQKEIEYIDKHQCLDRDVGLNIMRGGINPPRNIQANSEYMKKKWQDESYRAQMSKMLKSDEHKNKIIATRIANGNVSKPKKKMKKIKVKPIVNFVYKITSKANGLLYFGVSHHPINTLKNRHIKYGRNHISKFSKHIQTYGANDLVYEIMYTHPVQDKLSESQKIELRKIKEKYIAEFDTNQNGLNTAKTDVSDETRKKIGLSSSSDRQRHIKISNKLRKSDEYKNAKKDAYNMRRRCEYSHKPKAYSMDDVISAIALMKIGWKRKQIVAKYGMPTYTKALRERAL